MWLSGMTGTYHCREAARSGAAGSSLTGDPPNMTADSTTLLGTGAILERLPEFRERSQELREMLLANLIMVGEIPAPSYGEEHRIRFLVDRFIEAGLQSISTDEAGNGLAILPGTEGERNILLVAHADTVYPATEDHTVSVQPDRFAGPGIADNSLGVAVIATLPHVLEHLGIELRSNLILMGSTRGLGRANLEGLRFFLSNKDVEIHNGVCLEGVQLGRLSFSSIGMYRGEIACFVPDEYDWTRFGAVGSIVTANEVINRILRIPLPQRPRTRVMFGSIEGGGELFNTLAREARLRFEIRSDSDEVVESIADQIAEIASEVSSRTSAEVELTCLARRHPGGIDFAHPLARTARDIIKTLDREPFVNPSTSELCAFIDRGIPAITVGLSRGERLSERVQSVQIDPIWSGLAQLAGLLLAIDGGLCDED